MTNTIIEYPLMAMWKYMPHVVVMILALIIITWFLGRFVFKGQEEEEDGKSI